MGHSVAKIFARICTERSPRRTIEANLLDVPAGGHVENSPSSQTAVSLYVEKCRIILVLPISHQDHQI